MPLYLIASLGTDRVALPAEAIGSVVEVDRITPVPMVGAHVAGLCALRSRVLTVISTRAALDLPAAATGAATAVMCDVDGHGYALLFDDVADVVTGPLPEACPVSLSPALARAARGLVRLGGESLLLLDPATLVAGPAAAAA